MLRVFLSCRSANGPASDRVHAQHARVSPDILESPANKLHLRCGCWRSRLEEDMPKREGGRVGERGSQYRQEQ